MNCRKIFWLPLFFYISIFATENQSDTTKTILDSLDYSADKIIYELGKNRINLIGNSEIHYKNSFIKSDSILIDTKNRIAISEGESELFDGDEIIFGASLFYDIESNEGMLLQGKTKFEDGFYSGNKIRKVGDRIFDIDNAKYTTCELDASHYYIYSPKFRVFLNDKIVGRPVILYVNHFPIFALPFASFPIKKERHSGFLLPEPGYSKSEGKFLKDLSYFQIFGDYADVLFSLDILELTGLEFNLKGRYLKRYVLNGNVNSRFLYYYNQSPENYTIRWTINTFHKHTLSPFSNLTIKADFVSDADVRETSEDKEIRMDQDLHSYLYYSFRKQNKNFNATIDYKEDLTEDDDRTFYSKLYFSKKAGYHNFNIYGDFKHFSDNDEITMNLPSASFRLYQKRISQFFDKEKEEFQNWWDDFYFSYSGNLIHKAEINKKSPNFEEFFYHDTYSNGDIITEHREGVKHKISLKYERKLFGFLSFWQSLNYNEIWADKDTENHKLVRGYDYNTSATLRAPIYGIFNFNTKKLKAIRHIISPQITYTMRPDFSENDRFYTYPVSISSSSKSEKISFSIENKLQAKILDKTEKIKKLNNLFSLNSSFSYDHIAKGDDGKGFSDISHSISIMPVGFLVRNMNLHLSNSFKCKQYFYTLEAKNYSLNTKFSIDGEKNYYDYFPFLKSEEKNLSENDLDEIKKIQKSWKLSSTFSYSKNVENDYYSSGIHNSLRFFLTKNWSVDYGNYYNFKEHKLISQSINIHRDLHCWQIKFSWSKSGDYWSYRFQISAKKLPDLKFRHSERKY